MPPNRVPLLALRGGGKRGSKEQGHPIEHDRRGAEAVDVAKHARVGEAGGGGGFGKEGEDAGLGAGKAGHWRDACPSTISSMDTAQVDEMFSRFGGSAAALDGEEEVDLVDLVDSSASSATAARRRELGAGEGNRTVLQAFGQDSIFAGITLYNDSLGCGQQRPVGRGDANAVLAAPDSSENEGITTIDFELFDPEEEDADGLEPLVHGLIGPSKFYAWKLVADLIRQGPRVGAVQKMTNHSEVLGVASVLDLSRHAQRSWCQQILRFVHGYCPAELRSALDGILGALVPGSGGRASGKAAQAPAPIGRPKDSVSLAGHRAAAQKEETNGCSDGEGSGCNGCKSPRVGLVVCERVVNLPQSLALPLVRTYTHTFMHTNMHACMHAYIQTYIHTFIPNIHACIHTYMHTYKHIYIHTKHTYIHINMHTYKHAYIHRCIMHACTHSDIHPRIHTCMMHSVPNRGQTAAVTRPPPGVDYAKSTNLNLCQLLQSRPPPGVD